MGEFEWEWEWERWFTVWDLYPDAYYEWQCRLLDERAPA